MSDDILARVYAATTPEEISAAYADWAASYDRDTVRDGYHLPFTIAEPEVLVQAFVFEIL